MFRSVRGFDASMKYRLKRIRYHYGRFIHHFSNAIRIGGTTVNVLAVVASMLCLVTLVILIGYEHTPGDLVMLRRVLRGCQITFIVQVLYNSVLRFRATMRDSNVVKWITDMAVLVTLFPLLYPRPDAPWFPFLGNLIYSYKFIYIVLGSYATVECCRAIMQLSALRTNPSLLLSGSFLFFIIIGSFVLMLPNCTTGPLTYIDSLFLATSTVCITGLTPVDVSATFTPTGLAVLGVLIQIGGIGVLTFTSFFAIFFSGTTSVYNQLMIRDMVYSKTMNALIPTLLYIIGFTLTIETIGALSVYFTIPDSLGLPESDKIIFAAFHSLSSFCNAGFSCLPEGMANPALMTPGQGLYLVTSVLILAGAIGFPILVNFKDSLIEYGKALLCRLRGRRANMPLHLYDLNTKLVLSTTFIVLGAGTLLFFILEYDNTLAGMTLWQKISQSLFNSLIPRSAGFASVNPSNFLPLTYLLIIAQMWIGGASQSLGGGIKVNTVAAIFLNVRSVLGGRSRAWAYHRSLSVGSVKRANTVLALAIAAFLVFLSIIVGLEPDMSLKDTVFEVTSAMFTVGSSLGVTPELCDMSKITLCVAMFTGRVGIISILSGFFSHERDMSYHLPEENIIIN